MKLSLTITIIGTMLGIFNFASLSFGKPYEYSNELEKVILKVLHSRIHLPEDPYYAHQGEFFPYLIRLIENDSEAYDALMPMIFGQIDWNIALTQIKRVVDTEFEIELHRNGFPHWYGLSLLELKIHHPYLDFTTTFNGHDLIRKKILKKIDFTQAIFDHPEIFQDEGLKLTRLSINSLDAHGDGTKIFDWERALSIVLQQPPLKRATFFESILTQYPAAMPVKHLMGLYLNYLGLNDKANNVGDKPEIRIQDVQGNSRKELLNAIRVFATQGPFNRIDYSSDHNSADRDLIYWITPILRASKDLGILKEMRALVTEFSPRRKFYCLYGLQDKTPSISEMYNLMSAIDGVSRSSFNERPMDDWSGLFKTFIQEYEFGEIPSDPLNQAFLEMLYAEPNRIPKEWTFRNRSQHLTLGSELYVSLIDENPSLATRLGPAFYKYEVRTELASFSSEKVQLPSSEEKYLGHLPKMPESHLHKIIQFANLKNDSNWPYSGWKDDFSRTIVEVMKKYQLKGNDLTHYQELIRLLPSNSKALSLVKATQGQNKNFNVDCNDILWSPN